MSQIVGGHDLHPYQEPPAVDPAFLPAVNVMGQVTPASQIEIADAEVGSHGDVEGFFKCWEEQMLYVIENSWHFCFSFGQRLLERRQL
jgi:hypothetical protein